MSTSPVAIVNRALDTIRSRATVTSINPSDGTLAADVASRHYQDVVDGVLRAAHWNCARFQTANISLLKARRGTQANLSGALPQPPAPWLYEYMMPVSPLCLKPRFILPDTFDPGVHGVATTGSIAVDGDVIVQQSTTPLTTQPASTNSSGFRGPVPMTVAADQIDASGNLGKVILTNAEYPQLVYTGRIDVPLWDANLTNAVVHTLATWLCQPITGNNTLMAGLIGVAKESVMSARLSDGNEGWQQYERIPDWLAIRGRSGGRWGAGYGNSCYAGWDSLTFADGSML